MQTYQTGDSLIFKVPEREISLQPAALYPEAFPVAEAEAVIQPIALSIHSWVVQAPPRSDCYRYRHRQWSGARRQSALSST